AMPSSLWRIMQASYVALNATRPELTNPCWLCFGAKPPHYEAVGDNNAFRRSAEARPPECFRGGDEGKGFSVQLVTGKGTCVG
ncbi:ENV2 protein, partial [Dryoscopus gambensis]|nr:ENV2 protein [Dryoscopus gambensis]